MRPEECSGAYLGDDQIGAGLMHVPFAIRWLRRVTRKRSCFKKLPVHDVVETSPVGELWTPQKGGGESVRTVKWKARERGCTTSALVVLHRARERARVKQ